MSYFDGLCDNGCGVELEKGKQRRRRLPHRGGKLGLVCNACAEVLDQQGRLTLVAFDVWTPNATPRPTE